MDSGRCALAAFCLLAAACDREILVGADDGGAASCATEAGTGLTAIALPYANGFENGLGDWDLCYLDNGATFPAIVQSPVHSGQRAAAFTVNSGAIPGAASQSRCKKTGVLPQSAYYGAWYYVPAPATNSGNWNLFHFEGATSPSDPCVVGLWDVSLVNGADGGLSPSVYDFLRAQKIAGQPEIPIGKWFHLEVFLHRAADNTGRFTLYRDGEMTLDLQGISTDASPWGQWHVGNLATNLSPAVSTVYVDDVTISESGP